VAVAGSTYPRPEAGAEVVFTRYDEEVPLNAVNLSKFTGGARDASRKKTGIASRYYGSSYSDLTSALPNGKGLALGTTWCIEGWACADTFRNEHEGLFTTSEYWATGLDVGVASRMRLIVKPDGKLVFELECRAPSGEGFGAPALFRVESQAGALLPRDGTFIHFCVRRVQGALGEPDRIVLSSNGVRAGSVPIYAEADLGGAVPFFIGTSGIETEGLFKGSLDNFRIWLGDSVYPLLGDDDAAVGVQDFVPADGARTLTSPSHTGTTAPPATGGTPPGGVALLDGSWALDGTEGMGPTNALTTLTGNYVTETISELPPPPLSANGLELTGEMKLGVPDESALLKGAVSIDIQVVALDLDGRFTAPPDGYFAVRYEVRMANKLAAGSFEPDFSPWTEFTFGVYEFKYMQVRVFLSTVDAHYRPLLTSLRVYVDSPRRELRWTSKEVAVDGTYITFSPPFIDVPSIQVTPTGVNAKPVITRKTSEGFLLALVVDNGENVAAEADIAVFGFGEK
jgi:hypothetical protein